MLKIRKTLTAILRPCRLPFFAIILVSGCRSVYKPTIDLVLKRSNCNQDNVYLLQEQPTSTPFYQLDQDTILSTRFSTQSLEVAHSIGLTQMLSLYVRSISETQTIQSFEDKVMILGLEQKIQQRITTSLLEISAIASEMDCEEERADQVASFLSKQEAASETRLTVSAITVGAVGAMLTGIFLVDKKGGDRNEAIGIASGFAEAALGVAIILNKKTVNFQHERNPLKDIWLGNEHSAISAFGLALPQLSSAP